MEKEAEFPVVMKKVSVEFPGVLVFGLEILWNFQGWNYAICRISKGKVTNLKISGFFQKIMSSTRPLAQLLPYFFIWNSPISTKQVAQPKNWKMLNKLSHWNHFCSNGWKNALPTSPIPKKKHILLDGILSGKVRPTIKMNWNKILSCAVSIL